MYHLTIYRDRKKEYRWKLTATNGRKVANAGESYRRKIDCLVMARKLFGHLNPAVVE